MMTRTPAAPRGFNYRLAEEPAVAPLPAPTPRKDRTVSLSQEARKERAQLYKQSTRKAGIYGIRNLQSGRLPVGSALNLHGPLNQHRAELGFASHSCQALQADWDALGPEDFTFEVFDTVDPKLEGLQRDATLKELEQEWLANMQPLAERCYNSSENIRWRVY